MLRTSTTHEIAWDKLPDDFVLDDEPVDNINQPLLAAALTESLEIAGKLPTIKAELKNYEKFCKMNNVTNLEKARANVIKIVQTRFKQVPEEVVQTIEAIDNESVLEKLFTNSIIVADFEDFQKVLQGIVFKN